jgi:Protein of unknown function (DUF3800)
VNIFIDESGTFQPVGEERPHLISNVTALIVPESFAGTLFRKFRKTTRPWRNGAREIKGRELDEQQAATILRLVQRFDVLVISVCVDMGLHLDSDIDAHKNHQADKYLASLTEEASPFMRNEIGELAERVRALPNQLYVQAIALIELASHVLQLGTLYYVQRIPGALGAFRWRLDAKNQKLTEYERLWSQIVFPHLQTLSLTQPLGQMAGANYSAFARFEKTLPAPPEYIRKHKPDLPAPFNYIDMNALLKDLKFSDSAHLTGLQIVDVVASVIRRACNGTLQRSGWKGVGRLMPVGERGKHSIHFASLKELPGRHTVPYFDFVTECDREAKPMVVLTAAERAALRRRGKEPTRIPARGRR